jgi:hypothetical protein
MLLSRIPNKRSGYEPGESQRYSFAFTDADFKILSLS